MQDAGQWIYLVSTWVVPAIIAITLHEAAHGWVAWRLGDDTAKRQGRVTFNPLAHIDTFGTLLLPALLLLMRSPFLFGYAKPVPVDFSRLRRPRRDMVWVAAAGPATNLGLAVAAALLMHIVPLFPAAAADWLARNLANAILLNLLLAVFNMLPLPPLDGGRVAVGLLPPALGIPLARLERYGILILLGVLFVLPELGARLGIDIDLFSRVLYPAIRFLYNFVMVISGHV